jgi:hypothetical protein
MIIMIMMSIMNMIGALFVVWAFNHNHSVVLLVLSKQPRQQRLVVVVAFVLFHARQIQIVFRGTTAAAALPQPRGERFVHCKTKKFSGIVFAVLVAVAVAMEYCTVGDETHVPGALLYSSAG